MRKIEREIKQNVVSIYPTLDPLNLYYDKAVLYYVGFNISKFDHYLSEEEAMEMIVFYSNDMDKETKKSYIKIEDIYLNALMSIYDHEDIFLYKYDIPDEDQLVNSENSSFSIDFVRLYKFDSKSEFIHLCRKGLREKESFVFLLPYSKTILLSDYDLEVVAFVNRGFEKNSVFDYFTKQGLNILVHEPHAN